jgi:hypothetical protein
MIDPVGGGRTYVESLEKEKKGRGGRGYLCGSRSTLVLSETSVCLSGLLGRMEIAQLSRQSQISCAEKWISRADCDRVFVALPGEDELSVLIT